MKIWSVVRGPANEDRLQVNLNRLEEWSNRWLLRFNVDSCKRTSLLVQTGATRAVFQALRAESQELVSNEELMMKIHKLLCKLALCDRKFAFRARLSQCIPVTFGILRNQIALLQAFVAHQSSASKSRTAPITRVATGSTSFSAGRSAKRQSGGGGGGGARRINYLPPLPTSLANNIRILLETIHFYTKRPCRSNAVALCKSGLISLLVKAVSLTAGLPHIRQVINTDSIQAVSTESEVVKPVSATVNNAGMASATNNAAAASVASSSNTAGVVPPDSVGASQSQPQSAELPPSPSSPLSPTLQTFDSGDRLRALNLSCLSLEQASKACDIMVSSSAAIKAIANVVSATVATHRQMTPLGSSQTSTSQEVSARTTQAPPVPVATGVKHNAQIIQLFLSTLLSLMKWKRNIARASMSGAVPVLLDLFLDVHRCDLRCRRVQIQLLSLSCLQHLTEFRSGRKAILAAGGLFALFAVCAGFVGPSPNACSPRPPPPAAPLPPPKPTSGTRRSGRPPAPTQKPASTKRSSTQSTTTSLREDSRTLSTTSPEVSTISPRQASFTEAVLIKACILLRSCCPRIRLPIAQAESVLHVQFFEDREDQSAKKPPRPCSELSDGSASTPCALETVAERKGGSVDGTKLRRKNTPKEAAVEPPKASSGRAARTASTAKPPRSTRGSASRSTRILRRKPITDTKRSLPTAVVTAPTTECGTGVRMQSEKKTSGGLPSVQRKTTPSGSEISEESRRGANVPRMRSTTTNKGEGNPSKTTRRGSYTLLRSPSSGASSADLLKGAGGGETNVCTNTSHGPRKATKPKTASLARTKRHGGQKRRRTRCFSDESDGDEDEEEEEDDVDDDDEDDVDDDEGEEEELDIAKGKEGEEKEDKRGGREDTAFGGVSVVRRKQGLRRVHRTGAAGRSCRRRSRQPLSDSAFWLEGDSGGVGGSGGSDGGFSHSSSGSSSSCATPYLSDTALETAPQLTLGELLSTHQQFFPEWRDLPSTGTMGAFNLRFDDAQVASTETFFERLITDTEAAETGPDRYLIHAREVQSVIDYSVPQAEKLVAYPDLVCATGPPYKEPYFKHNLQVLESPAGASSQPVNSTDCSKRPQNISSVNGVSESSSLPNSVNPLLLNPPGTVPFSLVGLQHAEILDDVRRLLDNDDIVDRVVYDLDDLILRATSTANAEKGRPVPPSQEISNRDYVTFMNSDELIAGIFDAEKDSLEFESRFECGNLRKAIQVRQHEYDLILSPDVNTFSHTQWFYFRVSNIENNVRYRFNITNLEKPGSQYNAGMQPLVFSVCEAMEGRPYWLRSGENVKYYKNHFLRMASSAGELVKFLQPDCRLSGLSPHATVCLSAGVVGSRNYYTATFTIEFKHRGDVCYLAYHYPYSHSRLLTDLTRWQIRARQAEKKLQSAGQKSDQEGGLYFKVQKLASTLLGNPLPLLTVTERGPWTESRATSLAGTTASQTTPSAPVGEGKRQKPYIFLTGRVHPGETNASWVMRGLLERLTDPDDAEMRDLRRMFIFKIVPLLNPDGVICGNHRCSLAARDLNRQWINPSPTLHPTIYHTKCLVNLLAETGNAPFIYIDCHGHSRQKDVFLYGCDPRESWKSSDYRHSKSESPDEPIDESFLELADVLDKIAPPFSRGACGYSISRIKESTGRVVLWRQFKVARSYTLEASYCGVTRDCWLDHAEELGGVGDTGLADAAQTATATSAISSSLGNLMSLSRDETVCAAASSETGHQIAPIHLETMGAHLCRAFVMLQTLEPRTPRAESQAPELATGRSRKSSVTARPAEPGLLSSDDEEEDEEEIEEEEEEEEEALVNYGFAVDSDEEDDDDDDEEEGLINSSEGTVSAGERSLNAFRSGVAF
ncbi:hypothetical protein SprV_0902678700 [Sparganum proliferum]